MDLDKYKNTSHAREAPFVLKEATELAVYLKGSSRSIINIIRRNLRFEIGFAILFLFFDFLMMIFFYDVFFLRLFTILLMVFCGSFIFYVARQLAYVSAQYKLDHPVKELLWRCINIISKFTKLYFQVTVTIVPLILALAIVAAWFDRGRSLNFASLFTPPIISLYVGAASAWCFLMYFFTKWYIKKLYGDHLNKLKKLYQNLTDSE